MENNNKPKYVIAPKRCDDYLTARKRYEILSWEGDNFNIFADNGIKIYCRLTNCEHLNGGKWIIPKPESIPATNYFDAPLPFTIYPKYHQVERMNLWISVYLQDNNHFIADDVLSEFDKRFPVNPVQAGLEKEVD